MNTDTQGCNEEQTRSVTEEPYWHLEHEVLLAEAKANISYGAVEEARGSEHQYEVKVPRKRRLEKKSKNKKHSLR